MPLVELLTIDHTFWINGKCVQMLVLHPDFTIPKGWDQRAWTKRDVPVVAVTPEGQQVEATAQFSVSHFNIPDPDVPIEMRWRLTMWLTDRTKEEVPVGSKILISQEVRDAILPHNAA